MPKPKQPTPNPADRPALVFTGNERWITNRFPEYNNGSEHPLKHGSAGMHGLAGATIALETGTREEADRALALMDELAGKKICGKCRCKLWIFAARMAAGHTHTRNRAVGYHEQATKLKGVRDGTTLSELIDEIDEVIAAVRADPTLAG